MNKRLQVFRNCVVIKEIIVILSFPWSKGNTGTEVYAAAERQYCLAMRLIANWNIAAVSFQKEQSKIIETLFASGNIISFIHMKKQD